MDDPDHNEVYEVKASKRTTFWITVMSSKMWDQYIKFIERSPDNHLYLANTDDYNFINRKDIVFYYVKDRIHSGFKGIAKAKSNQILNDNNKIKIFADRFLNRYTVHLSYLSVFHKSVKLSQVADAVKADVSGFKGIVSFNQKFLRNTGATVKMLHQGTKLLNKLLEITSVQQRLDSYVPETESECSKDNALDDDDDVEDEDKDDKDDKDEEDSEENESDGDDQDNKDNKYDNKDEDSEENSENIEECVPNQIPIIINPCKQFVWLPDKEEHKAYFIDHYTNCQNCDVTDNNAKSLDVVLSKATIDSFTLTKKSSSNESKEWLEYPLRDYHSLTNHTSVYQSKKLPYVRIVKIDNGDEIYQGCLLITCQMPTAS